eukprot:TRINITY_DN10774_c0_g5_i1.p1 TRINITY_DN10774_c0_g5~~TRINITY_DN10774_c0_g5_i1.p1  ORF type:complete len:223 (-),score=45.79 TRINITY_DN10774_c0_g5_i1:77-745(-)
MKTASNPFVTTDAFPFQQVQRHSSSNITNCREEIPITRRTQGKPCERAAPKQCDIRTFLVINPLFSKRRMQPRGSSTISAPYQLTSESYKQSRVSFGSENRPQARIAENSMSLAFKWMATRYHNKRKTTDLQVKEGPLSVIKLNVQAKKNRKHIMRCLKAPNHRDDIENAHSSAWREVELKTSKRTYTRPISHTRIFKPSERRITQTGLEYFEGDVFAQVYK